MSRFQFIAFHCGLFASNIALYMSLVILMASPCLAFAFWGTTLPRADQILLAPGSWLASVFIGWFLFWHCKHKWMIRVRSSVVWWYEFITRRKLPTE